MSKFSSFIKSIIVLCVCLFTVLSASAKENILHSVEISQNGDSYNLKLKADEIVPFKKRVENKNSAYFELKSIVPAENIETIYNDVTDLDGVIIQQIDKTKIRIYVNGYMAAKTKVRVETAGNVVKESKNIVVNRPRSEYAPVTPIEEYDDNDWENNGFNLEYLTTSVHDAITGGNIDYMFIISLFIVVFSIMGVKKALFSNNKQSDDVIGISVNNRKIFDELSDVKQNKNDELIRQLNQPKAQSEKVTLNTGYVRPNIAKQNYAINSYNTAQNFNPYSTSIPQNNAVKPSVQRKVTPQSRVYSPNVQSNNIKRPTNNMSATPAIQPSAPKKINRNIDNIKFLESVTKIYEQSGRKDLAQGIKSNLSKQKIAI